jgi:hypothetical protein
MTLAGDSVLEQASRERQDWRHFITNSGGARLKVGLLAKLTLINPDQSCLSPHAHHPAQIAAAEFL